LHATATPLSFPKLKCSFPLSIAGCAMDASGYVESKDDRVQITSCFLRILVMLGAFFLLFSLAATAQTHGSSTEASVTPVDLDEHEW
jgi:hypothetical protein